VRFCNWPQAHQSDSQRGGPGELMWVKILFLNPVWLVDRVHTGTEKITGPSPREENTKS